MQVKEDMPVSNVANINMRNKGIKKDANIVQDIEEFQAVNKPIFLLN
jgi:hypothetical protein